MTLALVTVTGNWSDYGKTPAEGTVTFTPYGWRSLPDDDQMLAPVPDDVKLTAGGFSLQLVAPTDPADAEVRYRVAIALRTGKTPVTDTYDIVMPVVPAEGAYLDLADRDLTTGLMVIGSTPAVPTDPGDTSDDEGVWS